MTIVHKPPGSHKFRGALVACLVGLSLGAGGSAAFAGTALSAYGFYTVVGREYQNVAVIVTSSGRANARTSTQWSNGAQPVGWAGSRGRLFTSGGR